ncbi:carboxypeptidase-like regulatory domain-containing protein [Vibrio cyclitrophicus]
MNKINAIVKFIFIFVFSISINKAFSAPYTNLNLKVKNNGDVDIAFKIEGVASAGNSSSIIVLPVPFALKKDSIIDSAQDVKVAVASSGTGYTLLSVIAESDSNQILFAINNAVALSETSEGKAKLEIYPNFKYMTKTEAGLLSQPQVINNFVMMVELPKKFSATEVGFRPLSVTSEDNRVYKFSNIKLPVLGEHEYWLVFPSPTVEDLKWAQIIVSALFGVFTIAFHIPALKRGSLAWQVSVFILSGVILSVALYFSFTIAKKLDFGIFVAASIPHAIFGLISTIWLLIAGKYQALVTGTVHKSGAPVQFASVVLEKKKDNAFIEVKTLTQLSENGRFSFSTLLYHDNSGIYRVSAQMMGANDVLTNEFSLTRKQTFEVPNIVLVPTASPAP